MTTISQGSRGGYKGATSSRLSERNGGRGISERFVVAVARGVMNWFQANWAGRSSCKVELVVCKNKLKDGTTKHYNCWGCDGGEI